MDDTTSSTSHGPERDDGAPAWYTTSAGICFGAPEATRDPGQSDTRPTAAPNADDAA